MQLCSLTFLLWPGRKKNRICTKKLGCSYSNNYMQLCSLTFFSSQGEKKSDIYFRKGHVVVQFLLFFGKKFGYTEKSGCSYSTNYMQLDFGLFGKIQRHIQKRHVVVQFDFSSLARVKKNRICTEKLGCSYSNNYMQLDFGLFRLIQRHIQKCHVVAQFAFSSLARAEKKSDMYRKIGMQLQ